MLDLTEDVPQDTKDQTHGGDVDLSSFTDHYEANYDNDWSYFEDNTFEDLPLDVNALDADADADADTPLVNLESSLTQPLAKDRPIFFTDHTSESIATDFKKNDVGFPQFEDDADFLPTKRQKTEATLFAQHDQATEDPFTAQLQGNEFFEEVLAGDVPQAGRVVAEQGSAQEWFIKEFGEDLFNFVD